MIHSNLVAPFVAPQPDGAGYRIGSAFLVRIDNQTYLVSAAHLANYQLAPTSDWSKWADKVILVDEALGEDGKLKELSEFPLFFEGHKGKRVPRFKYALREDLPESIADMLLLPLQSDDLIGNMYSSFDLPADRGAHEPGVVVTQLGRRNEFPALSVTKHVSSQQSGPVRFMVPEGQPGDSGGPVISSTGRLLGMNVGSHVNLPNAAMLMSPEAIEALSGSVRGVAKDWPRFESGSQEGAQPFSNATPSASPGSI